MTTSTCLRTSPLLLLETPPADGRARDSLRRACGRIALPLAAVLLLALAAVAPAAADRRVQVTDNDLGSFEELITPAVWGFQCSGPVYHGILNGHEDLWLWFSNDFDPLWIHGQYVLRGSDYFSTAPNMGGNVISGPFKLTAHLSNHDPGPPETWDEILTGSFWNVQVPGFGSIFHETLGIHRSTEVTASGLIYSVVKQAVGQHMFDVEELCQSLGYELAP
jgi:hypothetical protein